MAQTPMGVGAPRWRGAKLGYSTQTGNGSDAAELGTGKGLIHVARNLSTSRLVSYGFLAQATELLGRHQLVPTGTVREVVGVVDAAPLLPDATLTKAAAAGPTSVTEGSDS